MLIGYARVSTQDQNLELQLEGADQALPDHAQANSTWR